MFFFLTQSEQGDIFKVTLDVEDELVSLIIFYSIILSCMIFRFLE